MTIFVTGATGFIGYNLIKKFEKKKIRVFAFYKTKKQINKKRFKYVKFFSVDIYKKKNFFKIYGVPKILIHLAWEGLPNYNEDFHLKKNLPNELFFLKSAIYNGVNQLIISGTCYEYGKQNGCLREEMKTLPITKYAKAKDRLRKELEKIRKRKSFILQWVRIFYVYGMHQKSQSLFPSLKRAIRNKKKNFTISSKYIVRDFISVSNVANFFLHLTNNITLNGVINCCSGKPLSIFNFVNNYRKKKKSSIKILENKTLAQNHEAVKFWGSTTKMKSMSFKINN